MFLLLYNTKCLFQGGGLWLEGSMGTQGYLSICTAQVIIGHTLFMQDRQSNHLNFPM